MAITGVDVRMVRSVLRNAADKRPRGFFNAERARGPASLTTSFTVAVYCGGASVT